MAGNVKDIVVVGAGVAGCTTAFFLAQEGARVTIVEREAVGSHASGYAFGGLNPLEGVGIPDPLLEFSLFSHSMHQKLAPELFELSGVDNQFHQRDRLVLAFDQADVERYTKHLHWQEKVKDFDVRWIDGDEATHLEPRVNPECIGALLVQGRGAVEAYRHTLALAQAAERLGAQIRHGQVTGLKPSGDKLAIELGQQRLEAEAVVLATGPWCHEASIWTGANLPIEPLKGQILRLRLESEPMRASLGWRGSYAASKPDGLIWAGTTEEQVGFDEQVTADGRRKVMTDLLKMAPSLAEAELIHQTACLRPVSPDGLPLVGRLPGWENVYVCAGAGRKGILWSTGMGRAAADLVLRGASQVPGVAALDPSRFAGARPTASRPI